jgi:crotonobetaine/carnitine-CoA ligase
MRDLDALNVGDFLEEAAREVPDAPFLIHEDETVSYREFNRRVDLAASSWSELGVRKGDRVAFMLENRPEFLQTWLGLAKLGAILVALNTRWQAAEIEYFLALTEPRFALVSKRHHVLFHSSIPEHTTLQGILTLGSDALLTPPPSPGRDLPLSQGRVPSAGALLGRGGRGVRGTDVISFIGTSGTTGRPKAVMQTHRNYVLTGEGYARWVELRPGERIYVCLPLFHINAQAYSVMGAIAARGAIVLVERFSASRFWPDMVRYGVNVFNYIGSMLAVLLKRDPAPEERRHSVRITYGGPAFSAPLRDEIEERFGITLISGIGMSENTYGLIEPLHEPRRSGSLGKPRRHPDPRIANEARVVDDGGSEVPAGETGELIFRNPVLMNGYYREPEQTAETIRDGWLYTGDLVRRDEDGYFYFVDRKKDIIRVRGENVSSSEVEEVLSAYPEVQEAAVVGIPSELTDEEIAAFIVPRPGSDPDPGEIIAWCKTRLADFKAPRHVFFVESLPKTETLRVEKPRLRQWAQERLSP